jgi:hypothetical protein
MDGWFELPIRVIDGEVAVATASLPRQPAMASAMIAMSDERCAMRDARVTYMGLGATLTGSNNA